MAHSRVELMDSEKVVAMVEEKVKPLAALKAECLDSCLVVKKAAE